MEEITKTTIIDVIITLVIIGGSTLVIIGGVMIINWFDKIASPECYITYYHKPIDLEPQIGCMAGYDEIELGIRLKRADFIQCCRKPHYLLQGYNQELIEDSIKVCMDSTNDDIRNLSYLNNRA
mgnify:FL=1